MRLGWFYLRLPDFEALGLDSAGAELGRRRQDPAQVITAALLRLSGVTGVTGVTDVIPSYDSVFVEFDAGVTTEARLRAWLSVALSSEPPDATVVSSATERTVTIPTVYGGRHGPDLAAASEITGLSEDRIVDLHTAAEYRVAAMGFLPGFAFMSGVPDPLRLARRSAPRPNVPAHSVAVANHQAGVYPLPSPGGWNLLGRSLVALYDPGRDEPFLVRPGDTVRFERAPRDAAPPADPAGLELLPLEPRLPVLRVLEPGLLDLVVDRGRWRMGRFGMARGGALDAPAAWFANRLLGNPDDAPLLESSLTGPVLEALRAVVVAVTGDALVPLVDGQRREPWSSFALRSGQTLSFSPGTGGSRSYLAVAGGLDTGTFEGSATTDLRGLIGRPLRAGDVMGAAARRTAAAVAALGLPGASDRLPPTPLDELIARDV